MDEQAQGSVYLY